ncbi:MAG: uncharacterized protein QOG82_1657 [Actinomycetota bacterium]|jgi:phage tail sheath protein FI|nr:uncharacterized protein [Actinomycetota bacterium]
MAPIEGVATATAGFAGRAASGPVGEARLVTSVVEFAALYGGLEPGADDGRVPYLAHAVRAFFINGGRRLYVSRVADDSGRSAGGALEAALDALAREDEIALVAAPDAGTLGTVEDCAAAAAALVAHAEQAGFRFALVDAPAGSSVDDVGRFRERLDSGRAALYHPWVVTEPAVGGVTLPPSGFVAGVYARGDGERGVLKPPTGDAVRGVVGLESVVDHRAQGVLNQQGVNVLRSFDGEGIRLWGARTLSSDPEWKYINIRRYLLFLEHSIDQSTQWAVFEPNGEALWATVRRSVEDFLDTQWRSGALVGRTPQDAYFVRCDRSTMTQDDLAQGRLVALVGVAPLKPAEFVIFRIGQSTAGAAAS